ncbi:MAG: hypothetical protein ACJ72N_22030 [Labedaea sp.]
MTREALGNLVFGALFLGMGWAMFEKGLNQFASRPLTPPPAPRPTIDTDELERATPPPPAP